MKSWYYIDEAIPYLEIRHLLVHRDGKSDAMFCSKYPAICDIPDTDLKLTNDLVMTAKAKIIGIVNHYDQCSILKKVIPDGDTQP